MAYSLLWLPDVLLDAGLKVAEEFGWQNRGLGDVGDIVGVICHHTGDRGVGNMPSLRVLINGRSDLRGPLAQLGLGRDGTYYILAAGRCQHAGTGDWKGVVAGNTHFIGIEAENRGDNVDQWPKVQRDAYVHGVAAILKHINAGADFCIGHKEWARKRTENKKHDPTFDMEKFRSDVAVVLNQGVPRLAAIPVREESDAATTGRLTLRRGMAHPLVEQLQRKLGVTPVTGTFGPVTEAAVRAQQRENDLVADGIVGPKTWKLIDKLAEAREEAAASRARRIAWGKKVSPEFRKKVRTISRTIGCDPNHLMACIAFESGETFTSSIENQAGSGAVGLIQFMPSTARALNTTPEALKAMTPETQLDYVARYFGWFPPVRTLEDVYMAILWPKAIGRDNEYALFKAPSRFYEQNSGLDANGDGVVTKFEAASAVRRKLEKGMRPELMG